MQEIWVGRPIPGTEVPERVDRILTGLDGHRLVEAGVQDDAVLR